MSETNALNGAQVSSETVVPLWLDEAFVMNCLQANQKESNFKVLRFDVKPALAKGENFLSTIFRVSVSYLDENSGHIYAKSLICKLALSDESIRDQLSALSIYEKEFTMYECILPKTKSILKRFGNEGDILATTILVDRTRDVIVFEDLVERDFGMSKRQSGYNWKHATKVLDALAKFHAANAVLKDEEPQLQALKVFDQGVFSSESNGLSQMFEGQLDTLIEVVSDWSDFDKYTEKLKKLRPKLMRKCIEHAKPLPHHFNTLIHGDLWTNNIMFSYNQDGQSKELQNVALIDFQYTSWASVTLDLHYFFNTSLEENLRLNRQEELVQFYHKRLSSTLHALGYKKHIPGLNELQVEFLEKAFYGFTSAMLVQPFMLNEVPTNASSHDLYGSNADERAHEFRQLVLSNPRVHQNIRNLMPIFERRGLLD